MAGRGVSGLLSSACSGEFRPHFVRADAKYTKAKKIEPICDFEESEDWAGYSYKHYTRKDMNTLLTICANNSEDTTDIVTAAPAVCWKSYVEDVLCNFSFHQIVAHCKAQQAQPDGSIIKHFACVYKLNRMLEAWGRDDANFDVHHKEVALDKASLHEFNMVYQLAGIDVTRHNKTLSSSASGKARKPNTYEVRHPIRVLFEVLVRGFEIAKPKLRNFVNQTHKSSRHTSLWACCYTRYDADRATPRDVTDLTQSVHFLNTLGFAGLDFPTINNKCKFSLQARQLLKMIKRNMGYWDRHYKVYEKHFVRLEMIAKSHKEKIKREYDYHVAMEQCKIEDRATDRKNSAMDRLQDDNESKEDIGKTPMSAQNSMPFMSEATPANATRSGFAPRNYSTNGATPVHAPTPSTSSNMAPRNMQSNAPAVSSTAALPISSNYSGISPGQMGSSAGNLAGLPGGGMHAMPYMIPISGFGGGPSFEPVKKIDAENIHPILRTINFDDRGVTILHCVCAELLSTETVPVEIVDKIVGHPCFSKLNAFEMKECPILKDEEFRKEVVGSRVIQGVVVGTGAATSSSNHLDFIPTGNLIDQRRAKRAAKNAKASETTPSYVNPYRQQEYEDEHIRLPCSCMDDLLKLPANDARIALVRYFLYALSPQREDIYRHRREWQEHLRRTVSENRSKLGEDVEYIRRHLGFFCNDTLERLDHPILKEVGDAKEKFFRSVDLLNTNFSSKVVIPPAATRSPAVANNVGVFGRRVLRRNANRFDVSTASPAVSEAKRSISQPARPSSGKRTGMRSQSIEVVQQANTHLPKATSVEQGGNDGRINTPKEAVRDDEPPAPRGGGGYWKEEFGVSFDATPPVRTPLTRQFIAFESVTSMIGDAIRNKYPKDIIFTLYSYMLTPYQRLEKRAVIRDILSRTRDLRDFDDLPKGRYANNMRPRYGVAREEELDDQTEGEMRSYGYPQEYCEMIDKYIEKLVGYQLTKLLPDTTKLEMKAHEIRQHAIAVAQARADKAAQERLELQQSDFAAGKGKKPSPIRKASTIVGGNPSNGNGNGQRKAAPKAKRKPEPPLKYGNYAAQPKADSVPPTLGGSSAKAKSVIRRNSTVNEDDDDTSKASKEDGVGGGGGRQRKEYVFDRVIQTRSQVAKFAAAQRALEGPSSDEEESSDDEEETPSSTAGDATGRAAISTAGDATGRVAASTSKGSEAPKVGKSSKSQPGASKGSSSSSSGRGDEKGSASKGTGKSASSKGDANAVLPAADSKGNSSKASSKGPTNCGITGRGAATSNSSSSSMPGKGASKVSKSTQGSASRDGSKDSLESAPKASLTSSSSRSKHKTLVKEGSTISKTSLQKKVFRLEILKPESEGRSRHTKSSSGAAGNPNRTTQNSSDPASSGFVISSNAAASRQKPKGSARTPTPPPKGSSTRPTTSAASADRSSSSRPTLRTTVSAPGTAVMVGNQVAGPRSTSAAAVSSMPRAASSTAQRSDSAGPSSSAARSNSVGVSKLAGDALSNATYASRSHIGRSTKLMSQSDADSTPRKRDDTKKRIRSRQDAPSTKKKVRRK